MPEAIFEYVDKNNKTHQVDDIYKVPEEYRGNVLVTGTDAPTEGEPVQTETTSPSMNFGDFDFHNYTPATSHYILLAAAIIFIKSKNFAIKYITGAAIALFLIYTGGSWFAQSDFMKTEIDQMAEDGENPGQ